MIENIATQLFQKVMRWILPAGILVALISAFRLFFLPKLKGLFGEAFVNFLAKHQLDQSTYHLISDVMLPALNNTTQIDHIIVSRYGIFVMETKTFKGWIYGDEKQAQWTQVIYRRKERFQNPLRQNYKHTKTLSDLTGIPHDYFKSLVIFLGCDFKTEMPSNVVYAHNFAKYIKTYQTQIIHDEQVSEIVAVIQEWSNTLSKKQKREHVKNLRLNKKPVSTDSSPPACPNCGEAMVLRTSKKDKNKFWGCPKYPSCKGIRQATEV